MSGSALGLISERRVVPQEDPGHAAGGQNGFAKAKYQQLGLRVIFLDRGFHLVQVVDGDHLTCALGAGN